MRSFAIVLICLFVCPGGLQSADSAIDLDGQWTYSRAGGVTQWFEIGGTGKRNNPLRRALQSPFDGDTLFVRYELRYDSASIDTPQDGNGEFLVLWMDEKDGGDGATHSDSVPNVGLHVDDQRNAFMARYTSSSQQFSEATLEGDRVYTIVAGLSRSQPGTGQPYDRLSVWIDPKITDAKQPSITVATKKAIRSVNWVGFSTGAKTEVGDRISVSEISLGTNWLNVFGIETIEETDPIQIPEADAPITQTVRFSDDVFPILRQHCFQCHSGDDPESGLRLDSYDDVLNQVTPRDADASHLVSLIKATDPEKQMPPPGEDVSQLDADSIDVLRRWIDEGVNWDHQLLPSPALQSDHWAFQPVIRPEIPDVETTRDLRSPIDAFVAQSQQQLGTTPAKPASWPTLQRRISLDLTGLPPSAFPGLETATSDEELDRWVEQLLASPAHAERWGRYWLDLARWAESNGHQHNRPRPHAWRYRDYVIESFQTDKPYDQFIREQIAGDESTSNSRPLEATGFLAAARYSGNELDKDIQRNDILVDVVNTTAKTFLGVTFECAQCHTHKFDPFTIRDYYRFQAFFTRGQPGNLLLSGDHPDADSWIKIRWQLFDSVYDRLVEKKRLAGVPEPVLVTPTSVVSGMNTRQRKVFNQLDAAIAGVPQVWGWGGADSSVAVAPHEMRWPLPNDQQSLARRKTYLRLRGDVKAVGPEVQPGWPSVFGPTPTEVNSRTELAEWMTSGDHPLTARVWVNRIWQWHFGTGLVETSGDFGTQGTPPTHPELLDWLADELVASGWSTRHIHRLILRSNMYRQSAELDPADHQLDPDCKTLWRWTPRRLESEAIRDSILSVAGKLDVTVGGPSVVEDVSKPSQRRSVYLGQQRGRIWESMTLFDSPPALATCSRRPTSTVALQPLYLLNSEFMQVMSQSLADRVRGLADDDQVGKVTLRLILGRDATREEAEKMREYLGDNSLESLCLSLLNLSEFLYLN